MKFWVFLPFVFSILTVSAWALPKYGPNAIPLANDPNPAYFQHHRAPDFWALISYYVPQTNDAQCSAATFTMVLNAARNVEKMGSQDRLLTLSSLIADDTDPRYADAMSGKTLKFDRSVVANSNLGKVLEEAIHKLGLATPPATRVDVVAIDRKDKAASRKKFHEALLRNEKSADDFVIISFVQGDLTGDPEGGAHVAAIGAYDSKKRQVLILDPDRDWYGPYWSPEAKVFDAISDPRSDSVAPGWIYVKFR